MQQVFRIHAALAGACAVLVFGLANAFAEPVALVIDISGSVDSGIQAFSEIEAGATVDLDTDGRLEFIDYSRCKNVIIVGGIVSFSEQHFISDGKIIDETVGSCPKVVTLNKDARAAGVLVRTGSSTLRLSVRPWLIFTGSYGDVAVQVRIIREGSLTLTLPIKDRQIRWLYRDDLLAGSYELEVLNKDGAKSRRLPFEVTTSGHKIRMTIIRMN